MILKRPASLAKSRPLLAKHPPSSEDRSHRAIASDTYWENAKISQKCETAVIVSEISVERIDPG